MAIRILVHGYFGFGNVGDEAILSVLIDEFRRIYDDVHVTVLSSNPYRTMKIHGVKAVREKFLSLAFWREFLKSHMLVFAGGGRYGVLTWRRIALLAIMAKLFGKKVIFRGIGVYTYDWHGSPVISDKPVPFEGITGILVRIAVELADFISVRDAYSYVVLRLNRVSKKVVIEDDLAFRMNIPKPGECIDIALRLNILDSRVIGINLRTLDPKTNKAVVTLAEKLIKNLLRKGFSKIVFIPFGFGSTPDRFFDNDLIIAKMLRKKLKAEGIDLTIVSQEMSPRQVLCLFNYLDYVIAMRHHAVIFALRLNKPLTVIVYDTKTLELMRRIERNA